METNQRLIAVIGKRRSGKTTAAEILKTFCHEASHLTMVAFGLAEFAKLHDMPVEDFWRQPEHNERRVLLGAFLEHVRPGDPTQFLRPFLRYIDLLPTCIIEDIFYFNELEALIKRNAMIILMDTDDALRKERNFGRVFPKDDPLESEVSSILPHMTKGWQNTHIVTNNKDIETLKRTLRLLV